ncbi:hypothetical protein GW17_00011102 [Ensete ventricosum]|nr:hypothetical protein GW17_00011102 [Ensete ventricosum]
MGLCVSMPDRYTLAYCSKAFLEKVLAENPGIPCFCYGHSTGAAIVLKVRCVQMSDILTLQYHYFGVDFVEKSSR